MATSDKKEVDQYSGVETTGHEWDGIKELNNPAPRWWLGIFVLCCIWAFGYWFVYPAWPTLSGAGERGGTSGGAGWTQYKQLKEQQSEIMARKETYSAGFSQASFEEIQKDAVLYAFGIAGGKAAFKDNCATCHGTGGAGGQGYPNLNDDDWLWGGSINAIYETIKYGIRAQHERTRNSLMPNFSSMLDTKQINEIASYVLSLASGDPASEQGAALYANCAACHGEDGTGNHALGAPNIVDSIWLHSEGDLAGISAQVRNPVHGMMPTWEGRLDEQTIRQLALYVHSLGGGE